MIFLSILIIFFIAQQFRLFLQWLFVSGRPCNPQTYGGLGSLALGNPRPMT